jgi:hypothetical protein
MTGCAVVFSLFYSPHSSPYCRPLPEIGRLLITGRPIIFGVTGLGLNLTVKATDDLGLML